MKRACNNFFTQENDHKRVPSDRLKKNYRQIKLRSWILVFSMFLSFSVNAQRLLKISVTKGNLKDHISYISKKGITYLSVKDISKILSGNFYYNPTAKKIEIKFKNYNLKITAKNQFFVLTSKSTHTKDVFQIPISTLLIRNDIFIPAIYSMKYLQIAYQKKLVYNDDEKDLVVTNEPINIFENLADGSSNVEITQKRMEPVDSDYDIYGCEISEMTNGTLIRLKSQKRINMYSSSVHEGKLYFFVSGASVDPELLKSFKPTETIKKLNIKSVKGNKQLEFTLKYGSSISDSMLSASKDIDSYDILITLQNNALDKFSRDILHEKEKWNFDVVVIDPGHGGKDNGTTGITRVKEKDVNLGISLELQKLLKKNMPDVKVVMTRSTDKFVELAERGKIANRNHGKLFISIHANSIPRTKRKSPDGFEVYLLRPGRTKEAIAVAEKENSVIDMESNKEKYKKLTNENFILVSMAHAASMRYSERFAGILEQKWEKEISKIPSRGVKQAGFYVLVGASMPSVLVETGFLSNKKDEAYLNSKNGQRKIAKTIYNSIEEYRKFYEKQMNN